MDSTPRSPPLIEFRHVRFGYGERVILDDVSFTVPRGKVTALMGASGGGKTTVMRLIGGQWKAQGGQVLLHGPEHGTAAQDVAAMGRDDLYLARRRMGMLFQFGALFTDMSVFDNVAFQMREHTNLTEEMIRDLVLMKLHAVGLRGAHAMMPSELSGGMARRVALARAIALDPMLIMYDEPFAGLDPISLSVVGELIRSLNDALGCSSIVVTHDVQESLKIVDYVYFVASGRIVAEGTPEDIKHSSEPYVHQFIWGEADGPVSFHYPAVPYGEEIFGEAHGAR